MIISKSRKYVFVHVPKTGGTSLTLALEDRAAKDDLIISDTPKGKRRKHRLKGLECAGRLWKHSRLADIDGIVSLKELEQMFCFTLVRNPWDRLVSYYHWLHEQKFDHPAVRLSKELSFEHFLRHQVIHSTIRRAPPPSYMIDAQGLERCDAYIRIEHMKEDLKPLEAHLGFALNVGRVNKSQRNVDYRRYYDASLSCFVQELCHEEIERFEYCF